MLNIQVKLHRCIQHMYALRILSTILSTCDGFCMDGLHDATLLKNRHLFKNMEL